MTNEEIPLESKRMVGVLIKPDEAGIFNNGLNQNGFFLYRLLQKIDTVQPFLVGMMKDIPKENQSPDNYITAFGIPIVPFNSFIDTYRLDVLICATYAVEPEDAAPLKATGTKFVSPVWGHKYAMNHEAMVFGHLQASKGKPRNFADSGIWRRNEGMIDAVWLSPHFSWTKQYLAACYDMPLSKTFTAPYIWSPEFVADSMTKVKEFESGKTSPYFMRGDPKNKHIYSLEPNINIVKTSLVPFRILETLQKKERDQFEHCFFYGGERAGHNKHFVRLVNESIFSLGNGKTEKISFEHRTRLSHVFTQAKVQLAHHFDCGLNYTYLEAAYYHHPIVHNSEFMKEMGYYYRGAAVHDAAAQLSKALRHEDRHDLDDYNALCDEVVHRYSIDDPANIEGYRTLIENLFTNEKPVLPTYIEELESQLAYGDGYFSPHHLSPAYLL